MIPENMCLCGHDKYEHHILKSCRIYGCGCEGYRDMRLRVRLFQIMIFIAGIMAGVLVIVMFNSNSNQLKTDQVEWETCRDTAWDRCFNDIIDDQLCNPDSDIFIDSDNCKILSHIASNCWDAQGELCDLQFDMDKIKTAKLAITLLPIEN